MKDFHCKQCGLCCIHSIPEFTREEYNRVKGDAKKLNIEFVSIKIKGEVIYTPRKTFERMCAVFEGKGEIAPSGQPVFLCEFLEDKGNIKSCRIYDKRPKVCRDFGEVFDLTKMCLNPQNYH